MVRPATFEERIDFERQRIFAEIMHAQVQAAGEAEFQQGMARLGEQIRQNPNKFPPPAVGSPADMKVTIKPKPKPDPPPVLIVVIL